MDKTVEFTTIGAGLRYVCSWMNIQSVQELEQGCQLTVESELEFVIVEQDYQEVINRINNAIVASRAFE